ncbi:uncharacterized protein LOC111695492 [Eurytemora carolleeae]|uniref:uncharacterized protein LOC111695492 n=1 Tax=Eurytemora carolleeae TaxID=1294199 RepID=UPI000C7906A5|nr:uncharacterized protein LOC111695492 [Eurytemora carolleeae]|eukprot:XP_023320607.1 uncharacterized protein LOC111695492 [Eurytemora affinis]
MSDPVNKFLKDCKTFSAFLDDLEKKTSKLDLEVNVLRRTADKGDQPSNAALQMLVDVRKMDQELKDEIRELTQTTEDNVRFLDGMLEQVLAQKKEVLHCKATVLVLNLL